METYIIRTGVKKKEIRAKNGDYLRKRLIDEDKKTSTPYNIHLVYKPGENNPSNLLERDWAGQYNWFTGLKWDKGLTGWASVYTVDPRTGKLRGGA